MRQIFKKIGLFAILAILCSACEKSAEFREFIYPVPAVTGMTPTSGYPNTYATITGSNFGTVTGAVKVFFGGIKADSVISCVDNQIVVKVPGGAVTGKVTLKVWTHTLDSIANYTVVPAPVISSIASSNKIGANLALPGIDTITIKGIRFGTDASKLSIRFKGTEATILSLTDNTIKMIAPTDFSSGFVTLSMGGLTLSATPAIINPSAPGDVTPYFLGNYGPGFARDKYDGKRWGTLAAPWITNAAGLNKGTYGGYAAEAWNGVTGFINWETWGNTPVTNGMVYQVTTLPAGTYTFSFNDYSEIQTNSSVYGVVAAGGAGLPVLANLSTAIASVALTNNTVVGTTKPSITETKSVQFTLPTTQTVSIGFLGNMVGSATGSYFIVKWIKLVKN